MDVVQIRKRRLGMLRRRHPTVAAARDVDDVAGWPVCASEEITLDNYLQQASYDVAFDELFEAKAAFDTSSIGSRCGRPRAPPRARRGGADGQALHLRADRAGLLSDALRGGAAVDPAPAGHTHLRRALLRRWCARAASGNVRTQLAPMPAISVTGQDALALTYTAGPTPSSRTRPMSARDARADQPFQKNRADLVAARTGLGGNRQAVPFLRRAATSWSSVA